jgi:isopentenyl diphosphate isomerase/L-lactate dehydrogenase-like FMN-dependent dehydrogenase
MYISTDWEMTTTAIRLAEKYGFTGLVITVDAQVLGIRKREKKYGFDSSELPFPVLEEIKDTCERRDIHHVSRKVWLAKRDVGMTWQTIKKIREMTNLKIVLKGITHPKDAAIAVDYCDAIWVSNHGGRQLDTVAPTITILSAIKAAAGNKIPILIDGGIRTGNDIFKCLALGADYVFLGRPLCYSLIFGQPGVSKLVTIL